MTEGTNWKGILALVLVCLSWYGWIAYNNKKKEVPVVVGKPPLERQYAFDICVQVCQGTNQVLIDAFIKKGWIDPRPDNAISGVIDDVCWNDCNNRIAP